MILPALNRCVKCRKAESAHDEGKMGHEFKRDDRLPEWQGWHAFRRGLATNLYRLRVPDKVIQAILRHSDLKTTMNIYVKTISEDAVNAMSALDSSLVHGSCTGSAQRRQGSCKLTFVECSS
jgi:integrase